MVKDSLIFVFNKIILNLINDNEGIWIKNLIGLKIFIF